MILLFAIFWLSIKQVSVWYNVFVFKQHETIKNVRVTSRKLHFELFMLLLIFSLHDIPCCICGIPWTCKRFLFERNQGTIDSETTRFLKDPLHISITNLVLLSYTCTRDLIYRSPTKNAHNLCSFTKDNIAGWMFSPRIPSVRQLYNPFLEVDGW